jgi:hypothetical protein
MDVERLEHNASRGAGDREQLLEDAMAYKMLINGKLVDGAKTLDVFNPATGGVLAVCPRADQAPTQ